MKKIIMIASLVLSVTACESLYEANDDGIPRIRSQRDVEAYNATVSSESEKLVCERERVIGSCLLYTSPSPRDLSTSRMPSSA